jgi:hypothetical protein
MTRLLGITAWLFGADMKQRIFEPLIADWQREFQNASPLRRIGVLLRGLAAFVCAVIVSSPRILMTPPPPGVADQIATRVVRFMALATVLFMIPPVTEIGLWWARGASWTRASLFLFAVPMAMTLAFPFAMTGAVDALRRRDPMPAHVARASVLKLGALAIVVMLIYTGWVVPAASQAARNAMNPAGMSEPLRSMRELSTYELLIAPERASVFAPGTYLASQSVSLHRELNQRFALVALPIALIWLRWRARQPLPALAATAIAVAALFVASYGGARLERDWALWAGSSSWFGVAVFVVWGLVARYGRPLTSNVLAR